MPVPDRVVGSRPITMRQEVEQFHVRFGKPLLEFFEQDDALRLDCWLEARRLRLLLVCTDCPPLGSPTLPSAVKNLGLLMSVVGQAPPQPRCEQDLVGVAHDCAVVADAGSTREIREMA